MIMELLGEPPKQACQCRQAEQVLGVKGCCVTPSSCLPADELPARCDRPRWPAFVEKPERYNFSYTTTCDALPRRQNDEAAARAAGVDGAHGRDLRGPAGDRFREVSRVGERPHDHRQGLLEPPNKRVLVVDPARLCAAGRDCEGELDEGFWLSYDEYVAGWDGMVHWVDFYGIKRKPTREN